MSHGLFLFHWLLPKLRQKLMACLDLQLASLVNFPRYEPNRLQINKKRYYVSKDLPNVPEHIVLPSVTTVASATAPLGKTMALINWRKKVGDAEANRRTRNAIERGLWLHGVLEDKFNGEDIEDHIEQAPQYAPYYFSISSFLEKIKEPCLIESAIAWYCPARQIGYAGTFDMLATMADGSYALLDWKTSYKAKKDNQLGDYRMQLGAYVQAIEQMYDIEIDQAHCAIAIYDPDTGEGEEAQIVSLDAGELVAQAGVMVQKTQQFFFEHYPGSMPITISVDKG